jgi:hypothetical protein
MVAVILSNKINKTGTLHSANACGMSTDNIIFENLFAKVSLLQVKQTCRFAT